MDFVLSVGCLINDWINRPTDDDLNHWRIVFNDRWSLFVVDDESNISGIDFDRSIDGIVFTGWRNCFARWERNFRLEWVDRLILVDEWDFESKHKGISERNGYGSLFELLTIGSSGTFLLGTTITRSSFFSDRSGSKV
jgi:hypothetical protein